MAWAGHWDRDSRPDAPAFAGLIDGGDRCRRLAASSRWWAPCCRSRCCHWPRMNSLLNPEDNAQLLEKVAAPFDWVGRRDASVHGGIELAKDFCAPEG